jgi:hypothetical protein
VSRAKSSLHPPPLPFPLPRPYLCHGIYWRDNIHLFPCVDVPASVFLPHYLSGSLFLSEFVSLLSWSLSVSILLGTMRMHCVNDARLEHQAPLFLCLYTKGCPFLGSSRSLLPPSPINRPHRSHPFQATHPISPIDLSTVSIPTSLSLPRDISPSG